MPRSNLAPRRQRRTKNGSGTASQDGVVVVHRHEDDKDTEVAAHWE
jgi:hypothetical protein